MIDTAYLRNRLAIGKFEENEKKILWEIENNILLSDSPFSKIILTGLHNSLTDIEQGDFQSAVHEMQLIHNLPFKREDINSWDENHFYHIELLSYIEEVDDIARIKNLIIMLSDVIRTLSYGQG